ncbi:MAG TPA: hypothetical protein VH281_10055, partial [Gaiellaceae bacterium]
MRLDGVRGRGGYRLEDLLLSERPSRRERHPADEDDGNLDRIPGERGACVPRSWSDAMTGFLLGLVFGAGVALFWASAVCGVEVR